MVTLPNIQTTVLIPRKKPTSDHDEPLHIFMCLDDDFCLPTSVSVISIFQNNPEMLITIHLVGIDLSEENIKRFRKLPCGPNGEVLLHSPDSKMCSELTSNAATMHFPPASFLRIMLPDLFCELERLVYLDGDTLCVGSLADLATLDLRANPLGVVLDVPPKNAGQGYVQKDFNSGFLVIDVKAWLKEDLTAKVFRVLAEEPNLKLPDQMALNKATEGIRLVLPKRFNFIQELSIRGNEDRVRPKDAVIVHYANRSKPWTRIYQTDLYTKYLNLSPWKKEKRELVYKKDPNSVRRYAKWLIKKGRFIEAVSVVAYYVQIVLERKNLIKKRPPQ